MITLDDAKAHLNVTTDDDDAVIRAKIDAASQWIALYTAIPVPVYVDPGADATLAAVDNARSIYQASIDAIPAPVIEACRQLVASLYGNREASLVGVTAQALPFGFLDLLAPYRAYAF